MDKTPLHYYGYIFVGFAHLTDNKFTHDEHLKVIEIVDELAGKEKYTDGDFAILMAEIMMWYDEIESLAEKEIAFNKHVDLVQKNDWLTLEQKEKFIRQLAQLAMADGELIKKETDWIEMISKAWGVKVDLDFKT
ncbi:MAG: TerB family tellurite resistance protein [Bacteroidetes bacterium]|nr:TerB family tellurite resistance protein [Bacteroidota bacterium]MBL6962532.1 TerB family tellurite resistance protein [Bacteroidota bacterium]